MKFVFNWGSKMVFGADKEGTICSQEDRKTVILVSNRVTSLLETHIVSHVDQYGRVGSSSVEVI